jgi:O-antigen/teichoic acid export membrane protein
MIRNLFYYLAIIIGPTGTFYVNYLLSKNLAVEEYGKFTLLLSMLGFLGSLMMVGQPSALSMIFFSKEGKNKNIYYEIKNSIRLISIAAIIFSIVFCALWAIYYIKYFNVVILLLVIAIAYFSSISSTLISVIGCQDKYKLNLIIVTINTIIIVSILAISPNVISYLSATIITSICTIFILLRSLYRDDVKIISNQKIYDLKYLFRLGWVAIPGMAIASLGGFIDRTLLGQLLSFDDVGIYSIAALVSINIGRIVVLGIIKPNAINFLKVMQEEDIYLVNKNINRIEKIFIAISILASIFYYSFSEIIIIRIFGQQYQGATVIILMLFLAIMVEGMSQFISHVLIQSKKIHILVVQNGVLLVLGSIGNFYLIKMLGLKGVAVTLFMINLASMSITYYYSSIQIRQLNFPFKFFYLVCILFIINYFEPV